MEAFINHAFGWANLPFTILAMVSFMLWILTICGLNFDSDADADIDLDVDLGHDADLDLSVNHEAGVDGELHADVDLDTGHDGEADHGGHQPGLLQSVLGLVAINGVPLTVSISLLAIVQWLFVMATNWAIGNAKLWISLLIALPILVVAGWTTRQCVRPLGILFRALKKDSGQTHKTLLGMTGIILSPTVTEEAIGQVEIKNEGAPITLMVRASAGQILNKGDEVVVIDVGADGNVYTVRSLSA